MKENAMHGNPASTTLTPAMDMPRDAHAEHAEAAMGEAQKVSLTSSPRLRMFAVLINVLVVSELFVAMYFAQQTPVRLTPVFFKIFFSLLVPTLVAAYVGRRLIARSER